CIVTHLMLNVREGFTQIGKFMVAWALDLANPQPDTKVEHKVVIERRKRLRDPQLWQDQNAQTIMLVLKQRFKVVWSDFPEDNTAKYVPIVSWPGVTCSFQDAAPQPSGLVRLNGKGLNTAPGALGDASLHAFVD